MPWTESRSRDEWLAEVQRRGGRIRRRRRVSLAVVGAFALVLPVSVAATVLRHGPERAVEMQVAGPAPAGAGRTPTTTPVEAEAGAGAGGLAAATPSEVTPPPAGAPSTTTTTEVHRRAATINGLVEPAPPRSVPPAAESIVERSTTTLAPPGHAVAAGAGGGKPVSSTTVALTNSEPLPTCPAEVLQIDVVPTKATFALGETVMGVGLIQVRTAVATACRLPRPASFRIEEVGTGKVLGSVPATTEPGSPATAEPGRYDMGINNFAWVPRECGGGPQANTVPSSACTQVPPGLYQAVIEWADGGPDRGWGEFRIGA